MADLRCDVLVLGAGPAGSAAARVLAGAGLDVVLADRQAFPRDKACGDALIPDALAALRRLGVLPEVLAKARRLEALDVHSPRGHRVRLRGPVACLPRRSLDEALRAAAVASGAHFLPRHRLERALERDGAVTGARMTDLAAGHAVDVTATVTVLATGAAAGPLQAFGVCERVAPSAMAGRVYVQVAESLAAELDALAISYDSAICPGYGWIFPGPDGLVNLGVGFFGDGPPPTTSNLRHLLARFVERFPPAARVWRAGRVASPLLGAPLRTALTGARLHRRGLLVTGEAAGLTYSFSGEGIGKAIEGAMLAAKTIVSAHAGAADAAGLGGSYARALRSRFGPRFRGYRVAQRRLAHPWLADALTARARPGSYAQRQLEAVFNETAEPLALFSPWGMLRVLVG